MRGQQPLRRASAEWCLAGKELVGEDPERVHVGAVIDGGVGTRLFNLIFFWYLLKPEIKALFDEDEAPATSSTKPKQLGGW